MIVPALHPDDAAAEQRVLADLRTARQAAQLRMADLATVLETGEANVGRMERAGALPRVSILSRWAAAVDRDLRWTLHGLPVPDFHTVAMAATAALHVSASGALRGELATSLAIQRLAAARRWLDVAAADVARKVDRTASAIHQFEREHRDTCFPAMLFRHARAIGGWAVLDLVSVPELAVVA